MIVEAQCCHEVHSLIVQCVYLPSIGNFADINCNLCFWVFIIAEFVVVVVRRQLSECFVLEGFYGTIQLDGCKVVVVHFGVL